MCIWIKESCLYQNVHFYSSRKTMTEAKDLAAKKDIKALEELSREEVRVVVWHLFYFLILLLQHSNLVFLYAI